MTEILVTERAAKLYGLALALDDPRLEDASFLIRQGYGLVTYAREHGPQIPLGRDTIYVLDAGATFLRACIRWIPEAERGGYEQGAAALDLLREIVIAAMARAHRTDA